MVISMIKLFVKECGSLNICVNVLLLGLIDIKFVLVLIINE